jgi:hypothetical protein
VMSPDMRFRELRPVDATGSNQHTANRGTRHPHFAVIARLADGVTLEQARAEIANLARGTARDYPGPPGAGQRSCRTRSKRLVRRPLSCIGRSWARRCWSC